jgi:hypothetical protein
VAGAAEGGTLPIKVPSLSKSTSTAEPTGTSFRPIGSLTLGGDTDELLVQSADLLAVRCAPVFEGILVVAGWAWDGLVSLALFFSTVEQPLWAKRHATRPSSDTDSDF